MSKKKRPVTYPPLIFNIYKPKGKSSQDIVKHFKYHLPDGFGKIGHFGTLDPFAEGVLMIGVAGAARLNELIHSELPKTYLAVGVLGIETETGDMTVEPSSKDSSDNLINEISKLSKNDIQELITKKFLGKYMQAPHKYSAAKFKGKALHEWARAGVEVEKEKKEREIYEIEVEDFSFPILKIRFTVSSGTYIRTLFSDCANLLGTIGCLQDLIREKVGDVNTDSGIQESQFPQRGENWDYHGNGVAPSDVLTFEKYACNTAEVKVLANGGYLDINSKDEYLWAHEDEKLLSLLEKNKNQYKPVINFSAM